MNNELTHHGVMGMKWGVRRSPSQLGFLSSRGKSFVSDILEKSAKNIGTQAATYAMGAAINKMAKKEIVNPKKGQKDK